MFKPFYVLYFCCAWSITICARQTKQTSTTTSEVTTQQEQPTASTSEAVTTAQASQPTTTDSTKNPPATAETKEKEKPVNVDAIVEEVVTTLNAKTDADPATLTTSLGGKITSVVVAHLDKLSTFHKITAYLGLAHIVGMIVMRIVNKIKKSKAEKLALQAMTEEQEPNHA